MLRDQNGYPEVGAVAKLDGQTCQRTMVIKIYCRQIYNHFKPFKTNT